MKLQFSAHQQYQIDAVESVKMLFEGQALESGDFSVEIPSPSDQLQMGNDLLIGNRLQLDEENILKNAQTSVERSNQRIKEENTNQNRNAEFGALPNIEKLDGMHFSTEMETGTGKTYVYLRTIHELHKTYGFKKFVIVVPSIPIREGVLKNLEITKDHFAMLYNNPKIDFYVYDPKKRGQLKNFATTNALQVLVINIDSFAVKDDKKESRIIHKKSDWGVPIEYLQAVNPIVIIDEPQNMETPIRKAAIDNLNPLCTLRYSATHKNAYNLIYKLDPVRAYDLGLVKKIEVDSIFSEDGYNDAYIYVLSVKSKGNKVIATLEVDKSDDYGLQRKELVVSAGDDLFDLLGREAYKGFVVDAINISEKTITFSNGKTYAVGQKDEGLHEEILKSQIRKTVQNHFEKEKRLKAKGIKVLSLFFIDRVANYRQYSDGGVLKGKFATWFEESYREMQNKFQGVLEYSAEEVHNGYFAQDKKTGAWKDSKDGEEGGKTTDDAEVYDLIMKKKEWLLDSNTPLRFIFSHSALREGWDNPNVFQICTLNETSSEMKKRQEIGRGLRLPVDQNGERVFDETVNILTVTANESYEDFAKSLQTEMEEDCGVQFAGRIKKKSDRKAIQLKKNYKLDENFLDLWKRIKHKTRYSVEFDTKKLITDATKAMEELAVVKPKISNVKVRLKIGDAGIETDILSSGAQKAFENQLTIIPDVLGGIQRKTKLTKKTIYEILKQSNKLSAILINPEQLIDGASMIINRVLQSMMIDGIRYEKTGSEWKMEFAENEDLQSYLDKLVEVQNQEKTLYDHIIIDSQIESAFAHDLDSREDVKFYFKLPSWFKIDTPIGGYNPDWAIVFEGDKRIYFVAETKGTDDLNALPPSERMRIFCGRRHFAQLPETQFIGPVKTAMQAVNMLQREGEI